MIFDLLIILILVLLAVAWVGYPLWLEKGGGRGGELFDSRNRSPELEGERWGKEKPLTPPSPARGEGGASGGLAQRGEGGASEEGGRHTLFPLPCAGEGRVRGGVAIADVVIAAHNEESCIRARIANLRALAAPGIRRIWVGDDASSDGTRAILEELAQQDSDLRVIAGATRQGKAGILRQLVAAIDREPDPPDLLVFTDANTRFDAAAVNELRVPFQDPRVGGVCGRLIFEGPASAGRELDYWARENEWKRAESRADSCVGANGAIYALRRALFWADLPANTIIDDFVIGMKVRERGWRMVYRETALAWEEAPAGWSDEYRRRVRIGSGAFQALGLCGGCLRPRYGRFAVMFALHKVVRWMTPLLGVVLVGGAMVRGGVMGWGVVSGGVLGGAVLGLVLAGVGGWLHAREREGGEKGAGDDCGGAGRNGWGTLLQAWAYFCLVQLAMGVGFIRYLRGGLKGSWERTERGADAGLR